MKELDESVKPHLMDAPPDCLDICCRAPHHNAVIPPLRSRVSRISKAVEWGGFPGCQVEGPKHARDIGR